jgi:hypothetical protein
VATREQRDELAAQRRRLARELRDAIYSLAQLHAQQQGPTLSWAVRGLQSAATQTQYCRLWEANLGGGICGLEEHRGSGGSDASSVLCTARSSTSSCSVGSGSEDGVALAESAALAAAAAQSARVLPLLALQQEIRELYRAKALHDVAVARGQRAFLSLPDFLAAHLALQCGREGAAVVQRAAQLQASVEAHAGVHEVAMFGLSAGMLEEATPGGSSGTSADGCGACGGSGSSRPGPASASPLMPATTAAAAAAPLVLYHRRRAANSSTGAGGGASGAVPALRRFCVSDWHAAFARSAARPPLPQPFGPAGADCIHGMASEVHNLALSVPGLEQLMVWVLGGGLGAVLPRLDLGLRLAENQVGG